LAEQFCKETRRKQLISLLEHPGWKYVVEYVDRKIENCGNIRSVQIEQGKTDAEIVRELQKRQVVTETLIGIVNYLNNLIKEK